MLSPRAAARHNGTLLRATTHLPHRPTLTIQKLRTLQTAPPTPADISRLASRPLHPLTLLDLCAHGHPPLSTSALLANANFTLSILPARLAHRIQSLRSLPYIVVANPNVHKIHMNYLHSLSTLLPYSEKKIETLEEEAEFTDAMADLVRTHSNTIAVLAKGFLEARRYIGKEEVRRFLDEHLRARIGTRLVAEQHIALHMSSQPGAGGGGGGGRDSSYIGVIDTALKPAALVRQCEDTVGEICELKYGVRPSVRIVGDAEATIAHIPMHIEYVLTELLKNSFRATIEAGMEREAVEVTIAPAPASDNNEADGKVTTGKDGGDGEDKSNNILAFPHTTPGVTIRIRDRGGGIAPENFDSLWDYGFTTFNEDEIHDKTGGGGGEGVGGMSALDVISGGAAGGSSLAGLGYGLPLGRAYAEYFGGGIRVQSLWGWGTDVYLGLRGVGRVG